MFGTVEKNTKNYPITTIESCCKILDSMRVPITSTDRVPGPYPYYGANGIQDYVADYIFDGGYVLLAEDGGYFDEIGRVAYSVSGKFWVNNHAHILKPCAEINVPYLENALNTIDFTNEVNGTTRQKLTQAAMRKIRIIMPPIEYQNQFADFLKLIDKSKFLKPEQTRQMLSSSGIILILPQGYWVYQGLSETDGTSKATVNPFRKSMWQFCFFVE